jgi:hypothetical protein
MLHIAETDVKKKRDACRILRQSNTKSDFNRFLSITYQILVTTTATGSNLLNLAIPAFENDSPPFLLTEMSGMFEAGSFSAYRVRFSSPERIPDPL